MPVKHFYFKFVVLICLNLNFAHQPITYPILLIVFDGFEADKLNEFLVKNPQSALGTIVKNGASANYVIPSLHILEFPNLMTLATGIYAFFPWRYS
jgi:hypothetical protein